MPTTPLQLLDLESVQIPGVEPADIAAFALEHTVKYLEGFTRPQLLVCPICVRVQFKADSALRHCGACGCTPVAGRALAVRAAYATLAAIRMFPAADITRVQTANEYRVSEATAVYYRSVQPYNFERRHTTWAYTPRGQALIWETHQELGAQLASTTSERR